MKTIDLYDNSINKHYLQILADECVFTFKEIKEFLAEQGLELKEDEKLTEYNIFDSTEFKIFRIFNHFRGILLSSEHTNYMEFREPYNDIDDFKGLKEARKINIEKRFNVEKNKILALLQTEEKDG
jgi:hypothetical protein